MAPRWPHRAPPLAQSRPRPKTSTTRIPAASAAKRHPNALERIVEGRKNRGCHAVQGTHGCAIANIGPVCYRSVTTGSCPSSDPLSPNVRCRSWLSFRSRSTRIRSRSRSGCTTSPRTSCVRPGTNGTNGKRRRGPSSRRRPRSGCTRSTSSPTRCWATPPASRCRSRSKNCSGATPASACRSSARASRPPASPAAARPSRPSSGCRSASARPTTSSSARTA